MYIRFIVSVFAIILMIYLTGCNQAVDEKKEIKQEQAKADTVPVQVPASVNFSSLDGLEIAADWYFKGTDAPLIIMCHQSSYNKYEYREMAMRLHAMGFNCLAIDQRAGGTMVDKVNLTHIRAVELGTPTEYIDAEQDIQAAISYADTLTSGNLLLMGSSYSASLVLKAANEDARVKAVIAFSPGEYFNKMLSVKTNIKGLDKSAFITSSRDEAREVEWLLNELSSPNIIQYTPVSKGLHGAKALWSSYENSQEYWNALLPFLAQFLKK